MAAESAAAPPAAYVGRSGAREAFPEAAAGVRLVLVTGVTGWIGGHVAATLIADGFNVRGTTRDAARGADKVAYLGALSASADGNGSFELVSADLTDAACWDDVVRGCSHVLHVASPVPEEGDPEDEDELLVPARDGTMNVLHAAKRAGVARVVVTGSIASVYQGHEGEAEARGGRPFDEADWSRWETAVRFKAYVKAKVTAERVATKWAKDESMEVVHVLPAMVVGPLLCASVQSSMVLLKRICDGSIPMLIDMRNTYVDVRDVAVAHVRAMLHPDTPGQRYIIANKAARLHEVAHAMNEEFGDRGLSAPESYLPMFAVRLIATWDKQLAMLLPDLGHVTPVTGEKLTRDLGVEYRPLEDSVACAARSIADFGIVMPAEPTSTGAIVLGAAAAAAVAAAAVWWWVRSRA